MATRVLDLWRAMQGVRLTILALVLLVALSFGAAAVASASPVVQQDDKLGQVSGDPAQSADEAKKEQTDEAPAPDGPGQTADSSPGDPAAGQQSQQGSTTEELLARRRAKFARLAPPERDGVESGLHFLETSYVVQRIRAGWHGFHPKLGGLPSGAGQAFGVVWRQDGIGVKYPDERTPNKVDFELGAAASIRGYLLVGTDLAFRRIAASPFNLQFHAGFQRNTQDDFFGFGPESREEDRTDFLYEQTGGGVTVWWQAPQWLSIGGAAAYRDNNVASGTDPLFLSTEQLFDPGDIPGLEDQGAFLKYDGFVEVDWRNDGNPYRGGFYAVRVTDWRDQDFGRFDFRQLEVDLQQYIPFLMDKRVIALRAKTVLSDADDGQGVPFFYQPTLGGSKELRGFRTYRFRDLNSLLLTAEYRFEIWIAMDMALFVDAGTVFRDHDDLDLRDLKTNYGFGFRVKTAQSTFLRADFAFGGEGFRYWITFDNVFDDLPLYRRGFR